MAVLFSHTTTMEKADGDGEISGRTVCALLIMNPAVVRQMIVANYGGVRIDGTNATIIGNKQGEFIADRNNIARVWMDHAFWPFGTTKLYIDQTGDMDILFEKVPYFKDLQVRKRNNTR